MPIESRITRNSLDDTDKGSKNNSIFIAKNSDIGKLQIK